MLLFPGYWASAAGSTQHIFVAIVAAMLGYANAASGMIISWKAQICLRDGLVGSERGSLLWQRWRNATIVFLVAIFLCQIVFGIYAMICETRQRRQEASHA